MRTRRFTSFVAALAVLALASFAFPSRSLAAAGGTTARPATAGNKTGSRGGVTISPAFQQISIGQNTPEVSFDFAVTNNTPDDQEFALSVVDFGSLDETGGVLFVGNGQKALNYRYALSPWVTLERDRIVVAPGATEKVPITVVNKESLTPGGHYGAVLVTPTDSGANAVRKVQIEQVASSLLFVKKVGGDIYRLNLKSFALRTHVFSLPGTVDVRFQNSGNVHVIPRGLATLTDPRGKVVKRGVINADSGIVLPETYRSLNTPLQPVATSWLPGRYKLSITYRFDDRIDTTTVTSSFLYLNALSVAVLVVLLAATATFAIKKPLRQKIITKAKTTTIQLKHRIHRH